MKRLYREMADLLRNGESFVTATVFDKTGSDAAVQRLKNGRSQQRIGHRLGRRRTS